MYYTLKGPNGARTPSSASISRLTNERADGGVRAPALILLLALILPAGLQAQTFTVLHRFGPTNGVAGTNSGGAVPRAGILVLGNSVYGSTVFGGTSGSGTLFKINVDGSGFTNLHTFVGASDGAAPRAPLVIAGTTLYGAASSGGRAGSGTLFQIHLDGTGFTNLHNFSALNPNTGANADGANPVGALVQSGNQFLGTAKNGGSTGNGTIFAINPDGTGFTNLHNFGLSDGANPTGTLLLSSNRLYGTTSAGGSPGNGVLFAINTDGSGFTNLYQFSASAGTFTPNSDGASPIGDLIVSGTTLYGVAGGGGATGNGTVFKLETDGTGFTVLYSFSAVPDPDNPPYVNEDGATPTAGPVLYGSILYGSTEVGGSTGAGTLFALNTDGSGFRNLHTFTADEGANPIGDLVLSGNTLYGTASSYYASSINLVDFGTVFSLSLAPQLTLVASGANLILSWPTNTGGLGNNGYFLQSTADLGGGEWVTTTLPIPPIVADGRFVVTLPGSTTNRQYFRLSR